MGNLYNQFDHKCPFCGKYHEQPHYKRSRHDRSQRRDCPFIEAFDQDHINRLKKQGLYKRKMNDKTPLLSMKEVENGAFLEKS
ncbi:hypothetical protein ACWA18_16285, partial [Bacillus pumilus]